ncbi:30S ribosome-binding factor RbfA [Kallotenue papyrolyticum]|uniref:30S ribosome-binding factor RbfA n=1 Tax=Kallotenue papyrolyticum TaxID=1325125 RepID=UPI0004923E50|nr:30S ribosome-binding factor RbfA [Kallotenue papyrolyticum]
MSKRTEQVGDEIQRILGEVIQTELKDPRIGFVTVTGVTVTPDLLRANVRVSIMGDEQQRRETMRVLERAKGYLRRRVGEELTLRQVPEIKLHLDTSLDHALRINELLRQIEHERQAPPEAAEESQRESTD